MSTQMDLKEIEKRAFRSTYQDGLWDIYYGLIVIFMALFLYRPPSGYRPLNIFLMLAGCVVSYALFWAGKRWITTPRLGRVVFGEVRRRKAATLMLVLGFFVLLQVILVGFTAHWWTVPAISEKINQILGEADSGLAVVSSIAALMVGSGLIVIAFFTDFNRGYYIGILAAAAVFLMVLLNSPLLPIIIGALILLPGIVLLVRFIKHYPVHTAGEPNE